MGKFGCIFKTLNNRKFLSTIPNTHNTMPSFVSGRTSAGTVMTHCGPAHEQHLERELISLRPIDTIWRHRSMLSLTRELARCLTAPSHTWTIVDLSQIMSSNIHLWAISQEMLKPSIINLAKKLLIWHFTQTPRRQWVKSLWPGDTHIQGWF